MMDTKKLRQKILDLAIRGKLVPQDPNDEPASVLLERIRAEKERLIKEGKIKRSKKSASDTPHYENVPFEIPVSWEWCQVSDIFELNPKNDVSDDTPSGFIPMASVEDGFGYSHTFETRPWGTIKKGYNHFQDGDIGIAKISPCFENRKSTIFYDLPNGIGAGTTELTVLRGYCVNNEFYLYLFQSAWYIFEGTKEFKGVVGQQRVNKEIFTTLLIPLPPLEEQGRIVAEIKQWFSFIDFLDDDKTDLNITIQKTKSKILELAIRGRLVPQNPNDEPAIELLKRINPKFEPCDNAHDTNQLPNGWTKAVLNDVCQIIMGSSPNGEDINSTKEGVEFHQGKLNFSDLYVNPSDSYTTIITKLAPKDSILLCVRAPVGVVNITPRLVCIGRGLCSLSPKGEMNLMFLFYALQTFQPHFEENATGTTFKAIGGEIVRQSNLSVPPINEQARIVAKIEELFAVLDDIKESLEA